MARVVLFHHVLGVTDGLHAMADRMREAGHEVAVPDLFDGHQFSTIEAGAEHVDAIGVPALLERAQAAVADMPEDVVYAGVSLGVLAAQSLAQTRAETNGAVFMESCVPATEFGDGWPEGLPVQIHGMDGDPFFAGEGDIDSARAIVDSASPGTAELFTYPGDGHLFVDPSAEAHDPAAAELVMQRVLDFLQRIDGTD